MIKRLYLGSDPSNYPDPVEHHPIIKTVVRSDEDPAICGARDRIDQFTHLIFTSRNCVRHFGELFPFPDACYIAIGEGTAKELGKECFVPEDATQEGVIALLETMDLEGSYIFLPQSSRARPLLKEYLVKRGVRHLALYIYDTHFVSVDVNPSDYDEIIFTSPSTVKGYMKIFGSLPKSAKAIGPITKLALKEYQ